MITCYNSDLSNKILFKPIYPTGEINCQVEQEGWLACLDNMDKLQQFLSVSDKNNPSKQASTMIPDQTAPEGAV